MTTTTQQTKMAQTLSTIAGRAIELTIRGEREFTASFEAFDTAASDRLVKFFGKLATCEVLVDEETGTYIYINVGAGR
jgi:hypothetical protein